MKETVLIFVLLLLQWNVEAQNTLQKGEWRGVFTLKEGDEAPFNFELNEQSVILVNGEERFELRNYTFTNDSVLVPIEIYDAVLKAKVENSGKLSGHFIRLGSSDAGIPFYAEAGKSFRFFEDSQEAKVTLGGKWDFLIGSNKTIGVFKQSGSRLTGTILSTTGDYRYFEGTVKGNEFYLSAFSGSNPSLIKGELKGDELKAEFINFRGCQVIQGKRNEKAALPDAYQLTTLKTGIPFDFSFPDAFTGKQVSLKDEKYKGKALIVTILGSWCPNCVDEVEFLAPWYKANRDRGVEIIGLAFERKNDASFAKARLETLQKRFGIEYDLLFAGLADKKYASQVLPALSEVLSFPTTIYIDKIGVVRKIHTGYTGPATGKYFEEFVKEFNADVNILLASEAAQNGK